MRSFVKTMIAGWRVVAVSIALSMATAFGIASLITPVYESRTQMFVSTSGASHSPDVYKVTMPYSSDTVVFDIVATDTSPELAREIANTMATELSAVVADLEATEDGEVPSRGIKTVSAAEASDAPISPNTVAYLAWGAAVGLLAGTALVLVRHRSNAR